MAPLSPGRFFGYDAAMFRTVLLTGTDHGLGAALACRLADQGSMVFAGVLKPPTGPAVEPRASGGSIRRLVVDIGRDDSVTTALAAIREQNDRLDLVINNGAILGDIKRNALDPLPLDYDEMLRVYNVNVLGSLRLSQACLPLLLAGDAPLIVNISSEAGSIAACWRDSWYAYAMSKAALNMQSALLHNLLKPKGGRVLVLHPGHVRTFMQGALDATGALSPEESADLVIANIERSGQLSGDHPAFLGPNGEKLPW